MQQKLINHSEMYSYVKSMLTYSDTLRVQMCRQYYNISGL